MEECKALACGEMVDTNYPVKQHAPETFGFKPPKQPAAAAAATATGEAGRCRLTLWKTQVEPMKHTLKAPGTLRLKL